MRIHEIKNMTPHPVTLLTQDGKITFHSEGVIRLSENTSLRDVITVRDAHANDVNIEIYDKSFGSAELPPKIEGFYYIVSLPVAMIYPRDDFIIPHKMVRDEHGRTVGCKSFAILRNSKEAMRDD